MLCLLAGCERGGRDAREAADAAAADTAARAPSAHTRAYLFVAGRGGDSAAALLELDIRDDGRRAVRHAEAWLHTDEQWAVLLRAAWPAPAIRDGLRPLPHGPLRILAGERGELQFVIRHAGDDALRLTPGRSLAAWRGDSLLQFRLRNAELWLPQRLVRGSLLELEQGPAPAPRAWSGAFLTDGRGAYLVFAASASGAPRAWLRQGTTELSWAGARLEPVAGASETRGGAPRNWSIAGAPGIRGELRLIATPGAEDAPASRRLFSVSGWIQLDRRRSVYGVLIDSAGG